MLFPGIFLAPGGLGSKNAPLLGGHCSEPVGPMGPNLQSGTAPGGKTIVFLYRRGHLRSKYHKNRSLDITWDFNLIWGGFEVGFGISVKNHADPWPQIWIWPRLGKKRFFCKFDFLLSFDF